jgi:hypothetical protein
MKKLLFVLAVSILLAAASAVPAMADTLYDNGPLDGNTQSYTINFGFSVSDSFTLSGGPSNLVSTTIGLWVFAGDMPSTVDWAIGTSFFGSDIGSGTSGLSNTFQFTNSFGDDVYSSTFDFGQNLNGLADGTYYLTLSNATTMFGNPMYWDQNNGPSQAMDSSLGSVPSETFQILGNTLIPTPEPTSLVLLGTGLLGLAGAIRKRIKA